MPLPCVPHDWTDPFYERVKTEKPTRMPITRLHLIKRCIHCGETREVFPPALHSSDRIQTHLLQ